MSQSHALQSHIGKLKEIRSILNAMKNLALIEIHKLERMLALQSQVFAAIETVLNDLLSFYPYLAKSESHALPVCLLVGTERGFCGDFNEQLIAASIEQRYLETLVIGSRLANKLTVSEAFSTIQGANVAEEVSAIVNRLIDSIAVIHCPATTRQSDPILAMRLTAIYFDSATGAVRRRQLLPFCPQQTTHKPLHRHAPLINLVPEVLFSDLLSHYLLAVLHEILFLSLTAENHCRLQHLEGAVNHLDDQTANLQRKSQVYRQEEITEEIEVILLNAENL